MHKTECTFDDAFGDPAQMMERYLMAQAYTALDQRRAAYEALQTPDQIAAYQQRRLSYLRQALGGFPKRTPLNARVVGELPADGYRVEKVIYESQPNHPVTAALYLPDGDGPHPAVLVPCGHTREGKAAAIYQRVCILLALHGLAALCYDPIGQGERYQVLDEQGQPARPSTTEHTVVGIGSILVGTNAARYRIWDGMRGLDYLQSRPDIDGDNLGCTGNSGGGTLTAYLMALDERITCAAPSCFLTTLRRLLETIGPQDAEQNIYGDVAAGLDHADFPIMRAPKPTLMCVATRDFFDIDGAWDTFRQAKRIYTRLGYAERMSLAETDETHGFSLRLREAAVQWMQRWLLGVDEPVQEPDFPVFEEAALQCTETGQVLHDQSARSVFDFNRVRAHKLAGARDPGAPNWVQQVQELSGMTPLDELPDCQGEPIAALPRDGYRLERWLLATEPGIALHGLAFVPEKPLGDAYLYADGRGIEALAAPDGQVASLAQRGHLVLAVDVRGIGEVDAGRFRKNAFLAYRLRRSYVGMRANDLQSCARFLCTLGEQCDGRAVHLVASGEVGPAALHAAAVAPDLFASITVRNSLRAWQDILDADDVPLSWLVNVVHGALGVYDLPDLAAYLGAKARVVDPVDVHGQPVG